MKQRLYGIEIIWMDTAPRSKIKTVLLPTVLWTIRIAHREIPLASVR